MNPDAVETICQPDADIAGALPEEHVARASVQFTEAYCDSSKNAGASAKYGV